MVRAKRSAANKDTLPDEVFQRIRGALFFGAGFKVTRNKLLFRDNLQELLAASVPGERHCCRLGCCRLYGGRLHCYTLQAELQAAHHICLVCYMPIQHELEQFLLQASCLLHFSMMIYSLLALLPCIRLLQLLQCRSTMLTDCAEVQVTGFKRSAFVTGLSNATASWTRVCGLRHWQTPPSRLIPSTCKQHYACTSVTFSNLQYASTSVTFIPCQLNFPLAQTRRSFNFKF